MAKPFFLAGFIVWIAAMVTFIYCLLVLIVAGARSGGFARLQAERPGWHGGGAGRVWQFATSSEFVHPHRSFIVNGFRISIVLIFVLSLAGAVSIARMKKTRGGQPPGQSQSSQ
jgi:hypothetical protein